MKWCLASFAIVLAQAQPPQTREAQLFGQIQAKVAQNVSHLLDYTCLETIERFKRSKPGDKLEQMDTIRLEVAYVGGRELFGWPGSNKIDDPDIGKFVPWGTSGSGDFGIVPRNLFLRPGAKIYYVGETELDGKRAIRYNYRVPEAAQSFYLQTDSGQGYVGYEGSFWVDPDTLDLMRLSLAADDIPEKLGMKSTIRVLDYSPVSVGGSMFLLPKSSEIQLTNTDGVEHRNRNTFSSCHQFAGQSVVKFDEPPPEVAAPPARAPEALPDEFTVEIELNTRIDSSSTAVGDQVRATFKQSVKSDRGSLIPKGAVLTGNIVLLEKRGNYYFVDLQFTSLELDGRIVDLSGRENKVDAIRIRNGRPLPMFNGPMFFSTGHLKLSRGTVFQFRSKKQRK